LKQRKRKIKKGANTRPATVQRQDRPSAITGQNFKIDQSQERGIKKEGNGLEKGYRLRSRQRPSVHHHCTSQGVARKGEDPKDCALANLESSPSGELRKRKGKKRKRVEKTEWKITEPWLMG